MRNFSILPKEINHKSLFLFGFLYYLLAPLIIHETAIFNGLPGIYAWKYNLPLTTFNIQLYCVLIIWFLICFLFGSSMGKRYVSLSYPANASFGPTSSKIILFLVSIFVLFFIYKARGQAFRAEYHTEDMPDDGIGVISTANLLLFYIHFAVKQPRLTKRLFFVLFVINSIFLLGMGGRMYIIIPAVAYYVRAYNRVSSQGKSLLPYTLIPFVGAVLACLIGAIRIGENASLISYFFFAEPIFTSYSAFSYLSRNTIPLFEVPNNFIVSFLNIIPSLFWPQKQEFIGALLEGFLDKFTSPLGALSVFVSIFEDFGIILGGLFMTVFGVFFGQLYRAYKAKKVNKNTYYLFCSILPFSFFRDPIGISIKIFILSYIILPFILKLTSRAMSKTNDTAD